MSEVGDPLKWTKPVEFVMAGNPDLGIWDRHIVMTSAAPITMWRGEQFELAVDEAIVVNPALAAQEEELKTACWDAAWHISDYNPSEEEAVTILSDDIQLVAQVIGSKRFRDIYTSPPPTEIVEYLLNSASSDKEMLVAPQIGRLTTEVLNGRLEWDDRFAAAGAPTPERYVEIARSTRPGAAYYVDNGETYEPKVKPVKPLTAWQKIANLLSAK